MVAIFDELQEDGKIIRRKGDYQVRQGQINKPIPESEGALLTMQVLHGLLRSFDHLMKMVVHIKAGVFEWSEDKTPRNFPFIKQAKEALQTHIYTQIHEKWDQPDSSGKRGTTTNGNSLKYSP